MKKLVGVDLIWLFQGNPKHYDIDDYLSRCPGYVYWRTPTNQQRIGIGDRSFIWRAGTDAGIVAIGKIAELPSYRREVKYPEALGADLWQGGLPEESEKVTGISIEEIRLAVEEGMVSRSILKSDTVFKDSAIIKAPRATVFCLTQKESDRFLMYWHRLSNEIVDLDNKEFMEGSFIYNYHLKRERSSVIRRNKLNSFLYEHSRLFCEVCGLDPCDHYPDSLAESVLEVHHLLPLSVSNIVRPTRLDDLIITCANCHRAIHSTADTNENIKSLKDRFNEKN